MNESQRLEEESRFAQSMLAQQIVASAPMLTYVFDAVEQRNLYASPQITVILGYSAGEVADMGGSLIPTLIHPDDAQRAVTHLQDILACPTDTLFEFEYRMRHKAGHWVWLLSRDRVIERDAAGQPLRILGVAVDITDHQLAEARIAERERTFHELADAMPQIVWTNDAAGRVNYLNQRWLDYTGLTLEDSLRDTNAPVHPEDRPAAVNAWAENTQFSRPFEYELRLRRRDGIYRWFLSRCVPAYDEAGDVSGWYGTSTDIHDRKLTEEALRASEAQFRTLSESLPEMLWIADAAGNPIYQNPAWREYTGMTSEQLAAQGLAVLHHAEENENILRAWAEAQRAGEAFSIELRLRRQDGAYRWCLARTAPVKDASGNVVRWIGTINDIHDRRQAEFDAQFLADLGQHFIVESDPQALMWQVVQATAQHFDVTRAGFASFDNAANRITIHRDFHAGGASVAGSYPLWWLKDSLLARWNAGEAWVSDDIAADPRTAALFDATFAPVGLRAGAAIPLLRHGRCVALLFVVQDQARAWTAGEIALLRTVAERTWLAVESNRLQVETLRLNAHLEARVAERTEALNHSRDQLRRLAAHVERAREEERARIDRDVHDQLGGALTVLKMSLAQITRRLVLDETTSARLSDFRAQIDALVEASRRITYELRPSMLDDFGLIAAIDWQAKEWQNRTGIHCRLDTALAEVTLDSPSRTALFRAVQEALTNVARHADATAVTISIKATDAALMVTVRDNGRGISAERLQSSRSLGLAGMRERIREIGGEMEIAGEPDQGTVVSFRVPVHGDNAS